MATFEDVDLNHRTPHAGPNPEPDATGSLDFVRLVLWREAFISDCGGSNSLGYLCTVPLLGMHLCLGWLETLNCPEGIIAELW